MTLRAHSWGLTAVVLALASWSTAQAAPVASAEASLSNLRFRLIDLTPDDGIAPSVTFNTLLTPHSDYLPEDPGLVDMAVSFSDLIGATDTSAIAGLPDNIALFQGATLGGRSTLNSPLKADDVVVSNYTSSYATSQVNPTTGALVWGTQEITTQNTVGINAVNALWGSPSALNGTWDNSSLTLGPNTLLILEGTSSLSASIDPTNFQNLSGLYDFDSDYSVLYAGSGLTLTLTEIDPNNGIPDSSGVTLETASGRSFESAARLSYANGRLLVNGADVGEETELPPELIGDGLPYRNTRTENFLISFANGSNRDTSINLDLFLYSEASEQIQGQKVLSNTFTPNATLPTTPVIPEPSTWALMGLGLAGIGWAARRRPQSM